MKYSKLNKSRKMALRELYEFCLERKFTIVGTADFHDDGEDDGEDDDIFEIYIGVAGVEIECLPKEPKQRQRQNLTQHFLVDKKDGKWQKGCCR
jgi:hypothetical protein